MGYSIFYPSIILFVKNNAETNYPSKYFGLVLWNHGSGDLNPGKIRGLVNPSQLFKYDTKIKKIE